MKLSRRTFSFLTSCLATSSATLMAASLACSVSAASLSTPTIASDYNGSSFNEVLSVIQDKNFAPQSQEISQEFAVYQNHRLPQYPVNSTSIFAKSGALERDAQRTVNEHFDYYDRLPKKLHANGVCVAGGFVIDRSSPYSGYFQKGSDGLFIGRISVSLESTKISDKRGFGIAGKVFPTIDPDAVVKTGNFFAVDILLGQKNQRFLETAMTNEPDTGFDFSMMGLVLKVASALKTADEDPGFRPVSQIAKLGVVTTVKTPKWIRIAPEANLIKNNQADFRNEVVQALKENKSLVFAVEVSDETHDRSAKKGWARVGQITIDRAMVSYGCDRRLHFSHPKKAD